MLNISRIWVWIGVGPLLSLQGSEHCQGDFDFSGVGSPIERVGRSPSPRMVCFTLGVLFLLLFETFRITPILYLFAACFGSGWGATAPLFMSIAADLYKGRNFGWIYGTLEGVLGIGAALGAYVGGAIFDRTGSYFWGSSSS